jgi:hypothetical protein
LKTDVKDARLARFVVKGRCTLPTILFIHVRSSTATGIISYRTNIEADRGDMSAVIGSSKMRQSSLQVGRS